jgi:hypothetical protein
MKKTLKAKLSSPATVSKNGTRKGHGVYQKKKSLDPTQDGGGGVEIWTVPMFGFFFLSSFPPSAEAR